MAAAAGQAVRHHHLARRQPLVICVVFRAHYRLYQPFPQLCRLLRFRHLTEHAAPARLSCRFVSTNAAHRSFFIFGFRWQRPRGRRWWSLQSGHQRRPSFTGGGFFSAFLDGRGFVGDFDMLRSRFVPDTAPTLAAAFNHARDCDTQGQATNKRVQ